ncbi:kinase-like protein [Neolentinus lepideus HHB14362 ss-1]|uniref:Kinase-like protein n=1 Tax=Neolentinus lepideus HHB14362 ss-1 TaxID=1314782 RepID=A0A165NS18_9AGAM|nr:kinase-like protein [Neolentinus lepideus HHB14362 ss-1]
MSFLEKVKTRITAWWWWGGHGGGSSVAPSAGPLPNPHSPDTVTGQVEKGHAPSGSIVEDPAKITRTLSNVTISNPSVQLRAAGYQGEKFKDQTEQVAGDDSHGTCRQSLVYYDVSHLRKLMTCPNEWNRFCYSPDEARNLREALYQDQLNELPFTAVFSFLLALCQAIDELPVAMFIEAVDAPLPPHLAGGSYGNIFHGLYQGTSVAIKQPRLSLTDSAHFRTNTDKASIKEALLLACLQRCPYIVPFIGSFISHHMEGRPVLNIVMPLLDRGNIWDYMGSKVMHSEEKKRFMTEIATALAWFHSRGVAHNDVACRNILVDGDGHARLSDLGQVSYCALEDLTQSPSLGAADDCEHLGRLLEHGPQRDVIMFGIACYEIWSGRPLCVLEAVLLYNPAKQLQKVNAFPEHIRQAIRCCWRTDDLSSMDDILAMLDQ